MERGFYQGSLHQFGKEALVPLTLYPGATDDVIEDAHVKGHRDFIILIQNC
jgi:hypothetical protein